PAATSVSESLSLHDALPISCRDGVVLAKMAQGEAFAVDQLIGRAVRGHRSSETAAVGTDRKAIVLPVCRQARAEGWCAMLEPEADRKSTRLNSSHVKISYAV